jgi:hypothetical protein
MYKHTYTHTETPLRTVPDNFCTTPSYGGGGGGGIDPPWNSQGVKSKIPGGCDQDEEFLGGSCPLEFPGVPNKFRGVQKQIKISRGGDRYPMDDILFPGRSLPSGISRGSNLNV